MLQDYGQSVETMHAYIVAQYKDLVRAFSAGQAVIHTELTRLRMQVAGIHGRPVSRSADDAQQDGDEARIAA
jgi:hypothetical protein